MGVYFGGRYIGVAKQRLKAAQIRTPGKHMRRKGMA